MHSPSSTPWATAKRVLGCLEGSIDHGLYYTKSNFQPNASVIHIRQDALMIADLPLHLICFWVIAWYPGVQRNKLLSQDLVLLRLSIDL
jgi:hypothetical protein